MWTRDIEVIEIIRHFEDPRFARSGSPIEIISAKEAEVILREIDRCRKDFSYAARNYFWIVNKDGEDTPFRLWDPQELILEKWYWLKHKFPTKAQKLLILKARQLGCSTLIEGLIAWSTIYFSNRNAMVVSHDDTHAAYLFRIMLDIYDRLPWWMKPMWSSRKQDAGLILANPNLNERNTKPGNNSQVSVQSATQVTGVGRGMKLSAIHASEFCQWHPEKFKSIIDGDMVHSLTDNGHSFAFLESTGRGSGTPSEEMWTGQVELGEEADWLPVFIPWFFERTRVMAPEMGWKIQKPEQDMRERIYRDWTRCSNPKCGQYFDAYFRGESRVGRVCTECHKGRLESYILTDEQSRYMQKQRKNAETKGPDAIKKLREELASTAEESFQLSGIQVFPEACHEFVNICIDSNPMIHGSIDTKGIIHWVKDKDTGLCGAEGCGWDHRFETEWPLEIWEMPEPGARYAIGVDVAEGLGGKADFSVIFVNRVSVNGRAPDVQVAMWRSNTVDPIAFAAPIKFLGRMYNEGLVSIEVNRYDTCFNAVRMMYLYPNLFVWKHYDSKNPISNKLGWLTTLRSKPMLWQTAVRWLKARQWVIRSKIFAHEIKRFQKDEYDDQVASAEKNFHDDVIMAGMIALFCSHDLDYSEDQGYIPLMARSSVSMEPSWTNTCTRCHEVWDTDEHPASRCRRCRCMLLQCHRNTDDGHKRVVDFEDLAKTADEVVTDMDDRPQKTGLEAEEGEAADSFASY